MLEAAFGFSDTGQTRVVGLPPLRRDQCCRRRPLSLVLPCTAVYCRCSAAWRPPWMRRTMWSRASRQRGRRRRHGERVALAVSAPTPKQSPPTCTHTTAHTACAPQDLPIPVWQRLLHVLAPTCTCTCTCNCTYLPALLSPLRSPALSSPAPLQDNQIPVRRRLLHVPLPGVHAAAAGRGRGAHHVCQHRQHGLPVGGERGHPV